MVLQNISATTLSVSQLNGLVGELVDSLGELRVEGEVSNFKASVAGHWYFSLKDDACQVSCVLFGANRVNYKPLVDGDKITVIAKPGVYKVRGSFQLMISSFERSGKGVLLRQIAELRARLAEEGLFDASHKLALPKYIACLGIVTSASGAALSDIVKTCARRSPATRLLVYSSQVQGDGAVDSIIQAIQLACEHNQCDCLIVGRGGGSPEDLMAYNDEKLIRAIYKSPIPIVSAIGHERDFLLADLVADVCASTPTAAAEMLTVDSRLVMQQLDELRSRLGLTINQQLEISELRLQQLQARVVHPMQQLEYALQQTIQLKQLARAKIAAIVEKAEWSIKHFHARLVAPLAQIEQANHPLNQLAARLNAALTRQLTQAEHSLRASELQLKQLNPQRVLERGFVLVSDSEGDLVLSAKSARNKDKLNLSFADDKLEVTPANKA